MADKKFIQSGIKKPGRVRRLLGIKAGKKVPMAKLAAKIAQVKKRAPSAAKRSLLSALILAKRFKQPGGI